MKGKNQTPEQTSAVSWCSKLSLCLSRPATVLSSLPTYSLNSSCQSTFSEHSIICGSLQQRTPPLHRRMFCQLALQAVSLLVQSSYCL